MTASHLDHPAAPPKVVAGLGCRRGCAQDELLTLLTHSLAQHELTVDNLVGLASIAHKLDEPGLHQLANHLNLELTFFTPEALTLYQSEKAGSALIRSVTGSPAVAEPCALALATRLGTAARLLGEKTRTANATCALARLQ
ncbi:cobalamin biosynthesis protein [Ectopseudomonas toyotomiensis]|uniref:Cobalamin biosynthesis protein n=1 Tax=Ectopseudomonas toyotomiensis TaxID=554344 RepID=A0AA42IQ69_9GAMM|nr:cobalamin biosynthesis protein [Pseudomonas toyotomiensis]MBG0839716.1 cobalamin biosynthesis protein [Pseudomonas toyotomiensis]MDH0703494.1 cobalamin biosynthesis protein [Pseudomonas toyotomiensis]